MRRFPALDGPLSSARKFRKVRATQPRTLVGKKVREAGIIAFCTAGDAAGAIPTHRCLGSAPLRTDRRCEFSQRAVENDKMT